MGSRRNFLKKSSSSLLGAPLLPQIFHEGARSPKPEDDQDPFGSVREELLISKNLVYLNTATLGPSPRHIVEGVRDLTYRLEQNPAGMNWGDLGSEMEAVRDIVASFIGAEKEEILLTRNTTEGLSLVTTHLGLQPGDEILTTNHEHGGGYLGPEYLQKYHGVLMRKIEMPLPVNSKEQVVDLIGQNISNKTRLLLLSHVSTVDGLKMPLKEISELLEGKDIFFLVDGAQSVGQVPIDVNNSGADAYATSGHKWLMGPKETGFLYLKKDHLEKFNPIFTEGGFKAYSKSSGTRNAANIIGLGQTIVLHEKIGVKKIEYRCRELQSYCSDQLKQINGLEIISPSARDLSCGIISVKLRYKDKKEVAAALNQRNIVVKQLPNYNALRFSCHFFNTRADIDKLYQNLEEIFNG